VRSRLTPPFEEIILQLADDLSPGAVIFANAVSWESKSRSLS